jgi:hypothetical protein
MRIYFSVDPEATGGESADNLKKLMQFLQGQGNIVYRAPYAFSENPDAFMQKELGLDELPEFAKQREAHIRWIDDADILLADVSAPSEGRSMILQRALDKPKMGLPLTPIILIKGKVFKRDFGKIVKGLIESGSVIYYEYENIDEVIAAWPKLLEGAFSAASGGEWR